MRYLAVFSLLFLLLAGCTHTHINQLQSPFPEKTKTKVKCKEYSSIQDATLDRRRQEYNGWMPTVIGNHDHYYYAIVWIAMTSTLEICYEKPATKVQRKNINNEKIHTTPDQGISSGSF